ncbi:MAG: T9SS type A sorting domain-containing protein, partial [Bacteroidota bacterium]|nr:T9SS type A sorting domain-containing protein [Bacteroidota bacterium]
MTKAYSLISKKLRLLPAALGLLAAGLAPQAATAQTVRTFDAGAALAAVTNPGPIYRSAATSTYYGSRYAYLYDAAELAAAGVPTGATITQLEWEKADANSTTRPGSFAILMRNNNKRLMTQASRWDTLTAAATTVYNNPAYVVTSTQGYLPFVLTTPFVYTGRAIDIYTDWLLASTGGTGPSTGAFTWGQTTVVDHILGICSSTTPTATTNLSPTSNSISSVDDRRPKLRITYTTTTGARRQTELVGQLYPNPTAGPVHLNLARLVQVGSQVSIEVWDAHGRRVRQTTARTTTPDLDLSDLTPGIYQVSLSTATVRETHRLTVA